MLCPLCRKPSLHLYHDNSRFMLWHHCLTCESSGDLVELAAAYWRLSVDDALVALRHHKILITDASPAVTSKLYKNYRYSRDLLSQAWDSAKKNFPSSQAAALENVGLSRRFVADIDTQRWPKSLGMLFGALPFDNVSEMYTAWSTATRAASRILPQQRLQRETRSVGDTLIVPYYTAPKRIISLECLPCTQVYPHGIFSIGRTREGGLSFLDLALYSRDTDYLIGVENWLTVYHVQARVLRGDSRPLPIVSWRQTNEHKTTAKNWFNTERSVIIWGPQLTPALLRQAIVANARIAIYGPPSDDFHAFHTFLSRAPGRSLERTIYARSRPWHVWLRDWVKTATDFQKVNLFSSVESLGTDAGDIYRAIGLKHEPVPTVHAAPREIRMHTGSYVQEIGCEWYVSHMDPLGDRQLATRATNFTIQCTHVITDPATQRRYRKFSVKTRTGSSTALIHGQLGDSRAWYLNFLQQNKVEDPIIDIPISWLPKIIASFNRPEYVNGSPQDFLDVGGRPVKITSVQSQAQLDAMLKPVPSQVAFD